MGESQDSAGCLAAVNDEIRVDGAEEGKIKSLIACRVYLRLHWAVSFAPSSLPTTEHILTFHLRR